MSSSALHTPCAIDYRAHWNEYFDADELELIERTVSTLCLMSDGYTLCVRRYSVGPDAPTVLIAHGMLGYGIPFARLHLPFVRAGFNVIQFDLPGMGFSSGRRGAGTIIDLMRVVGFHWCKKMWLR